LRSGAHRKGSRYVVVYRDPSGRQRKRFGQTLAEARDLKAALTTDVKRGEYRALSRVTFADYAVEWIVTYAGRTRQGIREETRDEYRRALGLDPDGKATGDGDAVSLFGRMQLATAEPRDMKRYAGQLATRGIAANTVRLALAPVKALFTTAVEEGLIRSNPTAGLRFVVQAQEEEPEPRAKALTREELTKLIAEVPEWRLRVEFLARTGLRISGALALTWADVDFGRRRVKVERRLRAGKMGKPKSSHSRREVPLSVSFARALWAARGSASDSEPVFLGRGGTPVDRTHLYRVVQAAGERAGVPSAGLHTLRHTAATLAFRDGWNAKQVQRLLGHHSAAFTLDTYVHLLPDDLPEPVFLDAPKRGEGASEDQVEEVAFAVER
jgi:integrase